MPCPSHVVAVTGFVTNADDRILLVRVAARGWEMPGGQVEAGEDLIAAVKREVEEASNCHVEVNRLIGVYSKLAPTPVMVLHLFACTHVHGKPRAREVEVPETGWFDPDEAAELVVQSPARERLRDALSAPGAGVIYRAYKARPYEAVLDERL